MTLKIIWKLYEKKHMKKSVKNLWKQIVEKIVKPKIWKAKILHNFMARKRGKICWAYGGKIWDFFALFLKKNDEWISFCSDRMRSAGHCFPWNIPFARKSYANGSGRGIFLPCQIQIDRFFDSSLYCSWEMDPGASFMRWYGKFKVRHFARRRNADSPKCRREFGRDRGLEFKRFFDSFDDRIYCDGRRFGRNRCSSCILGLQVWII